MATGLRKGRNKYRFLSIPRQEELTATQARSLAIGLAVVSFYVLDFALNGLQASLRNLLLDITPPGQLNAGNAWHGRMTNAGNIVGYGFGEIRRSDSYTAVEYSILRILAFGPTTNHKTYWW